MEVYSQSRLAQVCNEKGLRGTAFTKEPVFMLPLVDFRALLQRSPYNELFKEEILRLVGGHKTCQLLDSREHDHLVIAALTGAGMAYPDLASTSAVKAPVALVDLPQTEADGDDGSSASASTPSASDRIQFEDRYPFRDGDYDDCVTMELIRLPTVTNTGYVMETSTVQQLLEDRRRCPFTRGVLTSGVPVARGDDQTEYTLHNGKVQLGVTWMPTLDKLRKAAGLREFRRIQRIPMYQDFKELVGRSLRKELTDADFVEILERDFNANVSSASPCRRMVLGSELFGPGTKVRIQQFRATTEWPQEGHEDFFLVLPQAGVAMPYAIPMAGCDERGRMHPPNYYSTDSTSGQALTRALSASSPQGFCSMS